MPQERGKEEVKKLKRSSDDVRIGTPNTCLIDDGQCDGPNGRPKMDIHSIEHNMPQHNSCQGQTYGAYIDKLSNKTTGNTGDDIETRANDGESSLGERRVSM